MHYRDEVNKILKMYNAKTHFISKMKKMPISSFSEMEDRKLQSESSYLNNDIVKIYTKVEFTKRKGNIVDNVFFSLYNVITI